MLGNEQVRFGERPSEKGQFMAPRWRPTLRHVRCGGRPRETGRAESRHHGLGRSHIAQIHEAARGRRRAANNLALAALIATYAASKKIADQAAAIAEVIATE